MRNKMSSPDQEMEEPSSSTTEITTETKENGDEVASSSEPKPPAKRRHSNATNAVIEISDTDSDSDICAVTSYQASADEVKRIRGDEYSSTSSSSSSSDYSSDSESPCEDDSIVVEDEKSDVKVVRRELYPRANRMDDPKLNSKLKSQELIDNLKSHWNCLKNLSSPEITLTCDPFRVCLINELLCNAEIINNIVDDMNTVDWTRKKMDLYEFHQTADLAMLTWQRSIRGIYELLKTELMGWVSSVTGLELTSVSASCSLYGPGDHLLVHDDRMTDRRVAFILYLAPWSPQPRQENGDASIDVDECSGGWTSSLGGALQLVERKGGAPAGVVRSIYPRNNMLAFFPVGHDSFHQVGEVLSLELPRLSINGWFHGPAPADELTDDAEETKPPEPLDPHTNIVLMAEWVSPSYLSPRTHGLIQAQMEQDSEVSLNDLFVKSMYDKLVEALRDPDLEWEEFSPTNEGHFSFVPSTRLCPDAPSAPDAPSHPDAPCPLVGLASLLTSGAWMRMLGACTDLVLTKHSQLQIQRWRPGDYTLLPPREHFQTARLEALLYFAVPPRTLCGGATSYVAPEEGASGAALLTVPPTNNALSLVYCDPGSASFTKYLSKMTMPADQCFYIVRCTYHE